MPSPGGAPDGYVLARGREGRERLRILARIMQPGTEQLLDRVGIARGASCLDVGCGGGDVARLLAERVGPQGRVVGVDLDAAVVGIATEEADASGLAQLSFHQGDVLGIGAAGDFDLVYARFLLSHVPEPARALGAMLGALRAGALLVVEDIDFSGHICFPALPAFDRYCELYRAAVRANGGDADIGPKLPGLLQRVGLEDVEVHVSQPVALRGDVNMISALTMHSLGLRGSAANLTTSDEVEAIVAALSLAAEDPAVLMSTPRIVQSWARKPA